MAGTPKVLAAIVAAHCVVTNSAADDAVATWRDVTDRVLMPALQAAYPGVVDWTLQPLVGKHHAERLRGELPVDASVARLGSRSAVRLTWKQDRRLVHSTVWFAVEGSQPLLAASSLIQAGSTLTPALAMERVTNAVAITCTPVSSAQALVGMRARRTLQEGEVICEQLIEPRPTVTRGEDVVVRSTAGAITITAKGVAQQDAVLGQVLRIRNPSSGDTYLASVSGEGEVVVHE